MLPPYIEGGVSIGQGVIVKTRALRTPRAPLFIKGGIALKESGLLLFVITQHSSQRSKNPPFSQWIDD